MRRILSVAAAMLYTTAAASGQEIPSKLSLAEALSLAVERNPGLAASSADVDATRGDRIAAGRYPNPAFTFESDGPQAPFRSGRIGDEHEYVLRLDQELDTPGRRHLRLTGADLRIAAAEGHLLNARRLLELDVRRVYFQMALAKADLDVSTTALEEIDRVIALNRARFEKGEISGAEFRRVQVERLRFQDDVFAAQLVLRNARVALLALLNADDLGQVVEPTDGLLPSADELILAASLSVRPSAPSPFFAEAVKARPDVASARSEVRRAETATALQRAIGRPAPTLGVGYKETEGGKALVFGVTIPLPLFNRNQGGIARALAESRAATSRATVVEKQVALEVQQALNAVEINRERVTYIERDFLSNARESRDVILASYRLGSANLIDLLDAQRAFRDTLRTYNRALFEQRISLVELGAAIGKPNGAK